MPLSETWRRKQRDLLLPHTDLLSPHLMAELLQRTVPFREQLLEALRQVGNEKEWEKLAAMLELCLEKALGKGQHPFQNGD